MLSSLGASDPKPAQSQTDQHCPLTKMADHEATVVSRLQELCQRMPDWEAFVSYDESMVRSSFSMEEFFSLCARFAYILKQEGVLPGDYVTTTLPLSMEATIVTFGAIFAGAVAANLQVTFKTGVALRQCMDRLKSRLMIVSDEPWHDALTLFKPHMDSSYDPNSIMADVTCSHLPQLRRMMLVRRSGVREQSFIEMLRQSKEEYVYDGISPSMVAFLHFTTGTETEHLKMTEMTHHNALRYCDSAAKVIRTDQFSKFLYCNPWFWVASLPSDVLHGVTRVLPDMWTPIKDYPRMLLNMIKTENIKCADIQPQHVSHMLDMLSLDATEPPLQQLFVMGMPVTRDMLTKLSPMSHLMTVVYGSHEACMCIYNHIRADQVNEYQDFDNGVCVPGAQFRVVDDQWRDVGVGVEGRLLLKTPGMFHGYPGQPQLTEQRFDKDFWLITNDRGRIDSRNHLFVGGRIDSLILHGEYMIYPSWVEKMVAELPAVKEVVCVPVPDVILFHSVGVCVIRHSGSSVCEADIMNKVDEHVVSDLAHLFYPKHVLFFDHFPRLEDGTPDRSRLFDIVSETVGQ